MTLFQPEFGLMFWMLVVFLIVLGILAKFAWPVIIRGIEKRAEFIEEGVRYTQEAIARKKRAEEDAQALLADMQKKQLELLKETEKLKQNILSEAKENAAQEVQKILTAAATSAAQMKKDAELYIRSEIGMLSVEIAEKILRKELSDKEEQRKMVKNYLDELRDKGQTDDLLGLN